ncbi:MAG TPA: glycosyl hydrolase family 28-related protein [Longimicrobium sp.]|nr:glycosyl hydrolase family 28-related protein [Longimicrobium sp.]
MAIIEGTLLDEGGAVYNVRAHGVLGDGSTNDSPALRLLIDNVPADSTILFPPGTYILSGWTTVKQLTKRIRFVGSGPGVVLRGPGHTYDFLNLRAEVELERLEFENWRTVLDGQGSIEPAVPNGPPRVLEEVRATLCRASDLRYFVYWTFDVETDPDEEPGAPTVISPPAVRRLVVEDCHFEGVTHGILYCAMNAEEVIMRNNVVIDCVRYVCHLYKGEGEHGRGRLLFANNYVRGLTQGQLTGSYAYARVVQASAERIELVNNFIRDVSTLGPDVTPPQGGSNFAYISSSHLYVAGNVCWDVGSPGGSSAIIHEKNPEMLGAQIIGNSFIQSEANQATADGIQLHGENVLVDGVFATGLRGSVVATDRVKGGTIANVVATAHRGVACILVLGGRDIHVESPQVRGHVNTVDAGQPRGVAIMTRNDVPTTLEPLINDMENIRVTNAMIRDVKMPDALRGIGVLLWAVGGTMRRIAVHGGSILGCDRAVELAESTGASIEDLEILDTDLRDNRIIIHNAAVAGTLIVRDCRGYRTENRGTATVPAAAAFVTVAHGLARAPSAGGISVTPAGNLGAAARFWVDTLTATHFTIRTDAAPGGTGVPFAWQADAEEV